HFFFQAEDGIRDDLVTGVQTCALPICGGVDYEIAVLSDHGQVETTPFSAKHGRSLGSYLSEWLPDHVITEHRGQVFAGNGQARGRVEVTYSGGLAHIYFADLPGRLDAGAGESRYPGLILRVARLDGIRH